MLPLYINPVKIREIILFTERQGTKILALTDSNRDGIFKECTLSALFFVRELIQARRSINDERAVGRTFGTTED
ncbi:MAG: hypothetical protein KAV99_02950 [Candidatus Latescibacteria bacterium]|nr:hypothetical protein [Candidatus Latescibacterota bacterium]